DVLREATYQECHSTYVFKGIKIGVILFIISENFLSVCLIRLYNIHFSSYHHFGFEATS
ncbi:COX3 oxidase, partial [Acromyrmex charruanus]